MHENKLRKPSLRVVALLLGALVLALVAGLTVVLLRGSSSSGAQQASLIPTSPSVASQTEEVPEQEPVDPNTGEYIGPSFDPVSTIEQLEAKFDGCSAAWRSEQGTGFDSYPNAPVGVTMSGVCYYGGRYQVALFAYPDSTTIDTIASDVSTRLSSTSSGSTPPSVTMFYDDHSAVVVVGETDDQWHDDDLTEDARNRLSGSGMIERVITS